MKFIRRFIIRRLTFRGLLSFVPVAVFPAIVLFLYPAASPAGPCDQEEPTETLYYGGHLDSGSETYLDISTSPSERLEIELHLEADNTHLGAAVEWEILSETDLQLNWDCAAVYDPVHDWMYDRGDLTPCANPSQFRIASLIWGFSYSITVAKIDRIGWNEVGYSWETATHVGNGDVFCGSMNEPGHDCVTDHYFRTELAAGDTLSVHGIFTASDQIGSAVTLRLYDDNYEELKLLLNVAAYGTVEDDGIFVNEGTGPATCFMVLRTQFWDLWEYELDFGISGAVPPVSVTLVPDEEPVVIPPEGGAFGVTAFVENNTAGMLSLDGWVDIVLPGEEVLSAYIGPREIVLDPFEIFSPHLVLDVPPAAPPGVYIFRGLAGTFPEDVWNRDEFEFTKLP